MCLLLILFYLMLLIDLLYVNHMQNSLYVSNKTTQILIKIYGILTLI